MEWIAIISMILVGIALIIVEIIFIPGTTVVGIVGFMILCYAVFTAYDDFGTQTGTIVLIATMVSGGMATVLAFRSKAWERFSLKGTINSKVNEGLTSRLQIGDKGVAVSTLKPIGKAEFNDEVYEVTSTGNYIEEGMKIRISKISGNKITVEPN